MNKIHPILLERLKKQEDLYAKVTAFAEMVPLFAKEIIEYEYSPDEYHQLGYNYGQLRFAWGINWYKSVPINYPTETHSQVGFVSVYINNISLFGEYCYEFAHLELSKVLPQIKCHFFDHLNTTFYFLPDEAEDGLKILEKWYIDTKAKTSDYLKQKKREDLERQLKELE